MTQSFDRTNYKGGFWALIATQFQGAFSDNFFKWIIISLLLATAMESSDGVADQDYAITVASFAGILFSLPFIFFPGIFGAIADRISKQRVMVITKVLEVCIMTIGAVAVLSGTPAFLWFVLFLMATQSALFGPAKYGILPEMLPESRLSWGNGVLQLGTMVAIIAGVGAAGPLFELFHDRSQTHYLSGLLVGLAVLGLFTARLISKPPAANPDQPLTLNPFGGTRAHFQAIWADRWLLLTVVGYTYFWFVGALLTLNLVPYIYNSLSLGPKEESMVQVALALGIGVGAMAAGYASRGKIEVGLIPLGALGMSVFCALLAWEGFGLGTVLFLLVGLGFFGGVFDVPLAATLQQRSPKHMRGGIMATSNMLTFVGMAFASGLFFVLAKLGVGPHAIFLLCAVLTLLMGIYICVLLPVFVVRLGLWILSNTIYRVRILGRDNVPEHGGALLVANHTSFLDALVILASLDRHVRFIMYQGIYDVPWIRPVAKMMGAIPVMPGGGPREVVQTLRRATETIEAGDVVCIFAEGQITRTGQMLPFRKGFERIMKGVDAPIIPVHIDQIWDSVFSFSKGKVFWKWPSRIPFSITIGFGQGLPSDANAFEVRSAILELGTEAYSTRKPQAELLHRAFVKIVRRHPFHRAIADTRSGSLSFLKTYAGSIILSRKLRDLFGPEEMIGILLPQSVGSVLTNVALQLMGKIPVNLNYTASAESLRTSADRCGMKQVITSKAFLEHVTVEIPGDPIYLEDVMKSVEKNDRIVALLLAIFCPVKILERQLGAPANRSSSDTATVIFSSGSEGEPKGIVLSHYNILSNVEASLQVFPHSKWDCIVGMLPFFHSFGFTATLWLVLTSRLCAVYHPNPMEARAIGDLIKKYDGKILFSTSTFLHAFIRRCSPTQLSSLEQIVTGAEKLAPRVRDAFKEKFGIEPLEGYGTTECSPIVSLNVPDFRAPGFYQKGTKRGSIGHPLPGVSVRIVNTETREVLQNGEAGLLMVKGPNVMRGYLGQPEKTSEVLKDGWYETGDIATIDEDGFITITDRLARFSKLGGEMVSHTKIEEALHKTLGETDRVLAVAGVPDPAKGERLVVLHTLNDDDFDTLISNLDETGLPNLWIPKQKAFYKVEEIPVLGTGKMDLKAVKLLARKLDIGD